MIDLGKDNEPTTIDKREACGRLVEMLDHMYETDFCEALIAAFLVRGKHVSMKLRPLK